MISSREELVETLEKINGVPTLVVGDIILDRYIWGQVKRISPEAPVPVVNVQKVEDRLGGAGNAVRNLCGIGAKVSLCCLIGDDEEGQIVLKLLEEGNVDKDGVMIDRGHPTCFKTRVIAHSQQVVRIDREETVMRGVALREGLAAVVDEHLDSCKVAIVSDYGKGTVSESVIARLIKARSEGRIGLDVRPLVVDPSPVNYDVYSGISVAKPNRREAEIASGILINSRETALEAGKVLIKKWKAEMMVISLGEDGLMIVSSEKDNGIFLETVAKEVFDVSGAGDTVTSVFSAALGVGASPSVAGDLANIAAGVVVSEVGTVPIDYDKLRNAIDRFLPVRSK
ncbi:bifunctional ADP-heptose synthase [Oligoflexia bacterium]|nr:bifunctional ADP-heptose synthase [Oligoflexia bacterium]